ncbi:hypothetical protein FA15DRAFT_664140 [Coprinopsis marcescibilis]|uniref:Nucleic acid-binding protein n=1 Tax=Coprinopsis marcescibilis TaxID=230819 RepID=A0A5C3L8Z1_COPMA|nr:hypothetical protein FA15DRAFT_664140 [Coprinopsis marcescibilis]
MLSLLRSSLAKPSHLRTFSTSARLSDVAKLTLVGTLTRDPEARMSKNDKEYVIYTVATRNAPSSPDSNGERQSTSTFHRVLSFQEHSTKYLKTLRKGSKVYVEANYEVREPETGSDPSTPHGQRQIFLRHENIRVITYPKTVEQGEGSEEQTSY